MKKVTKVSANQQIDAIQLELQEKISQNQQLDVPTSVTISQKCRNYQLHTEVFESQFFIPCQKIMSFQTFSTVGTESDEEGCNKENIQMWTEPKQSTTIRQKKRSPLKDITSKVIKQSQKSSPSNKKTELREYMNSLFPSSIHSSSFPQAKMLRT